MGLKCTCGHVYISTAIHKSYIFRLIKRFPFSIIAEFDLILVGATEKMIGSPF